MKIGIIGATGNAGRAIYAEAIGRGHDVTTLVRDADRARDLLGARAVVVVKDAFDLHADDLIGFDVVVYAFSTSPSQAHRHLDLAVHLVSLLRETERPHGVRARA